MAEPRTLARPYARAAFAVGRTEAELWQRGLDTLSAAMTDARLRHLIQSAADEAGQLVFKLQGLLDADLIGSKFTSLLHLLVRNKRLNLIGEIAEQFRQMTLDEQGVRIVEVATAHALDRDERSQLGRRLSDWFEGKLMLDWREDPELLGGFTARSGDTAIDASIAGRLRRLARALKQTT
ncbi:MAG: F0F1 ATP synthase subunit delta [Gammaproteobacteria bacterium AqS3]|nr:F0F1 ATP synthase subunit delta [Gammaproteobacteria bacterium AqS3]